MNKLILLLWVLVVTGCNNRSGDKDLPPVSSLVRIVEDQDYDAFVKLSESMGYTTTSAISRPAPFVRHISNEPVRNGNVLSCFYSAGKVMYLAFTTSRPETYRRMIKKIEQYGFKKGKENFEKDDFRVHVNENKKDPEANKYELLFFKVGETKN